MKFGPAAAVDMSPAQIAGTIWEHGNHVRNVQRLTEQGDFDLGAPKSVKIGDRDAWSVRFTNKTTKTVVDVFFDKANGEVLGDETVRVVPTLAPGNVDEKAEHFKVLFKSFVNVDGINMAENMTIIRDGKPAVEVRHVKIRVVDQVDPKLFEKPK